MCTDQEIYAIIKKPCCVLEIIYVQRPSIKISSTPDI